MNGNTQTKAHPDDRPSMSNCYRSVHTQRRSIQRYNPMYNSKTSNEEQKHKKQSPSLLTSIWNYITGKKDAKSGLLFAFLYIIRTNHIFDINSIIYMYAIISARRCCEHIKIIII